MQDIATLGVINLRYCGYIATVKVEQRESIEGSNPSQSIELLDQPDGGANSLNINRYFTLKMFSTIIIHGACLVQLDFHLFENGLFIKIGPSKKRGFKKL